MRRGVLYGVIAFGLAVAICAAGYVLAAGGSLGFAAKTLAVLVAGLVIYPLAHGFSRSWRDESRQEKLGVALVVFALLTAGGGIAVAVVGRGPWLWAAACAVAIALVVATAGMVVLRRRPASDALRWHE